MTIKVAMFSDNSGGVYVYTCRLLDYCVREGFDVHLITHPPESEEMSEKLSVLRQDAEVHIVQRSSGIDQARQLVAAFEFIRPDVLIPNYRSSTYMACAMLSRRQQPAILGICHNDHQSYYDLLTRFESVITTFVCPAKKIREKLREFLPHRANSIKLIPHGVPLTREVAGYTEGDIVLVYHGRIVEEQKNISRLIALVRELVDSGVPARLKLIGSGSDEPLLRKAVRRERVEQRVSFLGPMDWEGIERELSTSHVAVLVSSYEGFCLSLAEAMGAGLPAVAFECGGVIDDYLLTGENGFIVPFGDLAAMRDRIAQMHCDPALWKALSRKAREVVKNTLAMDVWARCVSDCFRQAAAAPRIKPWPRIRPLSTDSRTSAIWDRFGKAARMW